jgi:hypothetical protein
MYGAENLSWEYGFPADFLEIKSRLASQLKFFSQFVKKNSNADMIKNLHLSLVVNWGKLPF